MENTFNAIQKEILKGALQERLGYDLYAAVMNNSWDKLPEKYRLKFQDFVEREGEIVILNNPNTKINDQHGSEDHY